jgi:hypothetical protein
MLSSAVSRTVARIIFGARGGAHHDRLHQAELADGVHKLGECLLVERLARLARIRIDLRRFDFAVHGTDRVSLR